LSHTYKELRVWQSAMALVRDVYVQTRDFPREELYGLTQQMRRAAVSLPSNIAEGQGRLSENEFRQFLGLARGSLLELETQEQIAADLQYTTQPEADAIVAHSPRSSACAECTDKLAETMEANFKSASRIGLRSLSSR